ncbi:MAG TPA: radical SAM protein, partial [Woeseiaceae bacterium]|nr:radical SAM protein [Woeseiaceae bacterium]
MQPIQFDEALIRRYGGRGPRYTSYPTAVQFHEFDEAQYKRQCVLSNERNDGPLSLYLHIPYCHTLCYYCGCNKVVTRNRDRATEYLGHLFREVELQSALFDDDRVVEQLHLGGGTPTYLSEEQLSSVMAKLGEHFRLRGDGQQEFSIEIDPRSIQPGMVAALAGMGFNRLSMGVQDFDPEV